MAEVRYALSFKQPWAALLVHGLKSIEVRVWPIARRGPVLIHAARIPDPRPDAVLPRGRGDAMTDTLPTRPTPGLLVSVRDPDEVDAAVTGGAGMIDVKEPSRGALGRAEDAVIAEVVKKVAGRCRVSAAL